MKTCEKRLPGAAGPFVFHYTIECGGKIASVAVNWEGRMHIVLVHIQVKPESIPAFLALTLDNARNSRMEQGVVRFDVLQQQEDPAKFVLVEVYRQPHDQEMHRQTDH